MLAQKKFLYLIAGLVLLILAALGAYLVMNQNDSKQTSTTNSANQSTNNSSSSDSFTSTTSPAELYKTKKNITCDVTIPDGKGKIYIGDKKFYGEFDGKTNGTAYKGYFIYNGQTAYVWSAGTKEGVRLELGADALDKSNPQSPTDLSKASDVKCTNWTVDNSKFTPPSGINFKDFTNLLPK